MKSLLKILGALFIGLCLTATTLAQTTRADKKAAKTAETARIINAMNYVFVAQYVNPLRGAGRQITDYDVTVTKNKVAIYLPYFGRVFIAPTDTNDGGIKLTTTNFDYKAEQTKKGDWNILIKPRDKGLRDIKDVKQLRLSVSSEGYASLQVTCFNRDPLSFTGYVEEGEKDKASNPG